MIPQNLPPPPVYLPSSLVPPGLFPDSEKKQAASTIVHDSDLGELQLSQEEITRRDILLARQQTVSPKPPKVRLYSGPDQLYQGQPIQEKFPAILFTAQELLDFIGADLHAKHLIASKESIRLMGGAACHIVDPTYTFSDLDFNISTTDTDFRYFRICVLNFIKRRVAQKFGFLNPNLLKINEFLVKYTGQLIGNKLDTKTLDRLISDMYLSGQMVFPSHKGSYLSLGDIDLNFIYLNSNNSISTADSFYVGVYSPTLRCRSGSEWGTKAALRTGIEHLHQRLMVVPSPDLYKLLFSINHKINLGFYVSDFSTLLKIAFERLPKEISHVKVGNVLQKHIFKHYATSPQKQLIARINFLFLLSFAAPEIQANYCKAVIRPWLKSLHAENRTHVAKLLSPLKRNPQLLPDLLTLIQGVFLLASKNNKSLVLSSDSDKKQLFEKTPHHFTLQAAEERRHLAIDKTPVELAFSVMKAWITLSQNHSNFNWTELMMGTAKELELGTITLAPAKTGTDLAEKLVKLLIKRIPMDGSEDPLIAFLNALENHPGTDPILGEKLEHLGIGQVNCLLSRLKTIKVKKPNGDTRYHLILKTLLQTLSFNKYQGKLLGIWSLLLKQNLAGKTPEEVLQLAFRFFEASSKERDDAMQQALLKGILPTLLSTLPKGGASPFLAASLGQAQHILQLLNEQHPDKSDLAQTGLKIQQLFKHLSDPKEHSQILSLGIQIALRFNVDLAEKLFQSHRHELAEEEINIREMIHGKKPPKIKAEPETVIPGMQLLFHKIHEKLKATEILKRIELFQKLLQSYIKEKAITKQQQPFVKQCALRLLDKAKSAPETMKAACELMVNPAITDCFTTNQRLTTLQSLLERSAMVMQYPSKAFLNLCIKEFMEPEKLTENLSLLMLAYLKFLPQLSPFDPSESELLRKLIKRTALMPPEQQVLAKVHLLTYLESTQAVRALELLPELLQDLNKLPLGSFEEKINIYSKVVNYIGKLIKSNAIVTGQDRLAYQCLSSITEHLDALATKIPLEKLPLLSPLSDMIELYQGKLLMLSQRGTDWETILSAFPLHKEEYEVCFFNVLEKLLKLTQEEFEFRPLQIRLGMVLDRLKGIPTRFQMPLNLFIPYMQGLILLFKKMRTSKGNTLRLNTAYILIMNQLERTKAEVIKKDSPKSQPTLQKINELKKQISLEAHQVFNHYFSQFGQMVNPLLESAVPPDWDFNQPLPEPMQALLESLSDLCGLLYEDHSTSMRKCLKACFYHLLPRYPSAYPLFSRLIFSAATAKIFIQMPKILTPAQAEALAKALKQDNLSIHPSGIIQNHSTALHKQSMDLIHIFQYCVEAGLSRYPNRLTDIIRQVHYQLLIIQHLSLCQIPASDSEVMSMDLLIQNYHRILDYIFNTKLNMPLDYRLKATTELRFTINSLLQIDKAKHPFVQKLIKQINQHINTFLSAYKVEAIIALLNIYNQLPGVTQEQQESAKSLVEMSKKEMLASPLSIIKMQKILKIRIDSALKSPEFKIAVEKGAPLPIDVETFSRSAALKVEFGDEILLIHAQLTKL